MLYEKMCLKARNLGGYPVDGSEIPNNHRLDVNKPCISQEKNPYYFPLYWLVYRDPYSMIKILGFLLLGSISSPIKPKQPGGPFFIAQLVSLPDFCLPSNPKQPKSALQIRSLSVCLLQGGLGY